MNAALDDLYLVGDVFGDLPMEQASHVETMVAADKELAAKIAVMRVGMGQGRKRTSRGRAIRLVGCLALVVAGLGAAWTAFGPRPLLSDNFNDGWFDSSLWLPPSVFSRSMGVKEQHGYMRLLNRGYLVTRAEFADPISVQFDWSWSDFGENPLYADHLAVVLRTAAEPDADHAFEAKDGVMVKFNAWSGAVEIWAQPDGANRGSTKSGSLKLAPDVWHHLRITNDGERVAVYVTGPAVGDHDNDGPVLEVRCPTAPTARHVAIYNREQLAAIPHESYIDNVVIESLGRRAGEGGR